MHAGKLTGKGYVARLWGFFAPAYTPAEYRNYLDRNTWSCGNWRGADEICRDCGWSTALSTHIAALRQQLRRYDLTVDHIQLMRDGKRRQYYRIERLQNAQQLEGEA